MYILTDQRTIWILDWPLYSFNFPEWRLIKIMANAPTSELILIQDTTPETELHFCLTVQDVACLDS